MRRWPTVTVSLTATTLIDAGGSSTSRRRTPCITPSNRQETELLGPATTRRPIPSHPSNPGQSSWARSTRRGAGPTRYHTAQHLLSALLLAEFDASTTGNQLYDDHAHLDAAYERFDDGDLVQIETRLNELVADERPVTSYDESRRGGGDTRHRPHPNRPAPRLDPELRIVEIGAARGTDGNDGDDGDDGNKEPYDRTACAGTHVANTAEIGPIVVTGRETKGSDEDRVRFALAEHVDGKE